MPAPESKVEVRAVKDAPVADVVALYKDAGWWDEKFDDSWVPGVVHNSFRFVGAFDGPRLVGMARALSDGVSDAYILDVTVLKPYRRLGIARRMVDALVAELESLEMDWIVGISEPDAVDFYRRIGIEVMDGYKPIRFGSRRGDGDGD